ncbi:unnamed protein product, partial [marine sediment metagenome]
CIIQERENNQQFKDLFELCRLVDTRKMNRKVLEALIRCGALDGFNQTRATLSGSINAALKAADQFHHNQQRGQDDLFASEDSSQCVTQQVNYNEQEEWCDEIKLQGEKDTLGFYLSGHPIHKFQQELQSFTTCALLELRPVPEKKVVVAGLLVAVRIINTKSGKRMAVITVDDDTAIIEAAVFPNLFDNKRDLLQKDQIIVIEGEVTVDDFTGNNRMSCSNIYDLATARAAIVP